MQKEWLIKNLIGAGDVVVLSGAFDADKTSIAMGWAMAVASGTLWRGQPVNQGGVVYLGRPLMEEKKRIARLAFLYTAAMGIDIDKLPFSLIRGSGIDLLGEPGEHKGSELANPLYDLLEWHRKKYGSLRLVVIDTVADYFQGDLLTQDITDDILAMANAVTDLYRCAVVLSFECEPKDGPISASLARLSRYADAHYRIHDGILKRSKPYSRNKRIFKADIRAEAEKNKVWQPDIRQWVEPRKKPARKAARCK